MKYNKLFTAHSVNCMQDLAGFSWVDIVIASIVLMSLIVGFGRGAVKTVISIFSWIAAFYIAIYFSSYFASFLEGYMSNADVRLWATRVIIFVVIMVIGAILGNIVSYLIAIGGMKGVDRLLGFLLGGALGAFIVATIILLVGLTNFIESNYYKSSVLIPFFTDLSLWLKDMLPGSLVDFINITPNIQVPLVENIVDRV